MDYPITNREAVDLIQAAVDDAVRDLEAHPEPSKEWADIRINQLRAAMEVARDRVHSAKEPQKDPPELIIMRGVPGSGKTTWARVNCPDAVMCCNDEFHMKMVGHMNMIPDGFETRPSTEVRHGFVYEYQWDPKRQGEAAEACMAAMLDVMAQQKLLPEPKLDIVVANTNVKRWMYENYVAMGNMMGYRVRIVEMRCDTIEQVRLCMQRCIHGVPLDTIARMAVEMEHDSRAELVQVEV